VSGENYVMRSLMICTPHTILCGDKIKKNEMGGTCRTYGDRRGVCRVLVVKPDGKRPLGRTRGRWEDNIKKDLQEVGCGSMDWIKLAEVRDRWRALVNAVMKLGVP
jgi:hypothetical protein